MSSARFNKKIRGFTLVEVIATMAILLFGIVGALSAVTLSVRASSASVDRFVATALAQEGLEIVRNTRDNNWIDAQTTPPDVAFNDLLDEPEYLVYAESTTIANPPLPTAPFGEDIPKLVRHNTTGEYGYDTNIFTGSPWAPAEVAVTKYTRTVTVSLEDDPEYLAADEYMLVTSTVSWGPGSSQSVSLTTHLYDWRPL